MIDLFALKFIKILIIEVLSNSKDLTINIKNSVVTVLRLFFGFENFYLIIHLSIISSLSYNHSCIQWYSFFRIISNEHFSGQSNKNPTNFTHITKLRYFQRQFIHLQLIYPPLFDRDLLENEYLNCTFQ